MKDRKYCFERFSFYDKVKIEKRLTDMAEQGWLLEKIGVFLWSYKKIEPQKISVSVVYFPKAEALTIEPTEGQKMFYEFCEHTGWKLLCDNGEMQVLYSTEEDPLPIETDIYVELGAIHDTVMKYKRPFLILLISLIFLSSLLCIGNGLWNVGISVIPSIQENRLLYGFVIVGILDVLEGFWDIGEYYLWRRRALKRAEIGELEPVKRHFWVDNTLTVLQVFVIIWALRGNTFQEVLGVSLFKVIFYFAVAMCLPVSFALYLREKKASQKEIMVTTFLTTIVAAFLWFFMIFMGNAGI